MDKIKFRKALRSEGFNESEVAMIQKLADKHLLGVGAGFGGNNTLPSEDRPSQTHAGLVGADELRERRSNASTLKRMGSSEHLNVVPNDE